MTEPLAIGLHAASKAGIKPGDTAVVAGCGTIGLMTALACRAGGCGRIFVVDIDEDKLKLAREIPGVIAIDASKEDSIAKVKEMTDSLGVDLFFEATGAPPVIKTMCDYLVPGGTIVAIGMPPEGTVSIDIVAAQAKEITIKTIFRYVNIYPRALELLRSGSINLKPFINKKFPLDKAVEAFEYVAGAPKGLVKAVIEL
jgi:D-xylulose reductase